MDAHEVSTGLRGPCQRSLPVLAQLPAAAYPSISQLRGRTAVLQGGALHGAAMHFCPECGGWVEGEAVAMTGGWQDEAGEHWCTTYHCRRCGDVIHDDV